MFGIEDFSITYIFKKSTLFVGENELGEKGEKVGVSFPPAFRSKHPLILPVILF